MRKVCVGLTLLAVGLLFALPAPALAKPAFAAPGAAAARAAHHPRMDAALNSLITARRTLNEAATVFGGHRVNAIKATDQAINEVRAALSYAATGHVGPSPRPMRIMGGNRKAAKGFPGIHRSMNDLNTAKAHLQKAGTNFGGHRVAAIKYVNQALSECEAALRYAGSR